MTKTAKAAVMTAAGKDLEIKEYPLPEVAGGCILVKVTCCTICGSDVHSWMGRRAAPTPIILGHEIVGQIVELGAGVTHDSGDRPLQIGDPQPGKSGRVYSINDLQIRAAAHQVSQIPSDFGGNVTARCILPTNNLSRFYQSQLDVVVGNRLRDRAVGSVSVRRDNLAGVTAMSAQLKRQPIGKQKRS